MDVWPVLGPVSHRGVIELPGPLWPSLVLYSMSCFFFFPLPISVHFKPFAPPTMIGTGMGRSLFYSGWMLPSAITGPLVFVTSF